MKIQIFQISVNDGRREADPEAVQKLADSISKLGLLNPITVDKDYTLIAGLHRLEAAKLLGWSEIECNVSSLEGLLAELAEVDENFVRKDLSDIERGDLLLRRKEIYEMLHPETKAGIAQAVGMNRAVGNNVAEKFSATSKPFVQDTAEKLGVTPRTVRSQIQTAKNLTAEAKDIIRDTGTKITKAGALKLSRLPAEQQADAANQLVAGTIKSVDEYRSAPSGPETVTEPTVEAPQDERQSAPSEAPAAPVPPPASRESYYATTKDSIDDLKNPDKDRTCTPETFVASFSLCLGRFRQSIETYTGPAYESAIPALTPEHLAQLQREIQSVCTTLDNLYRQIERSLRA